MDNKFSDKTKIIIIIVYLILVIITEQFYREPLKIISISLIINLQNKIKDTFIAIFFSIITNFGSEKVLIPMVLLFLFFNPLIYFYYLIFSIITSTYFASLMKLIYLDYRPYWDDNQIFPIISCDMGYGNPSGHTLVSTVTYLGLWKLLQKNRIQKKKIHSLIILFCMILMICFIVSSRLIGGVHNLNQFYLVFY